ncbi:MAG: glycoside hydrolase family 38 C-terminal domain-containing protein, partial [Phycisphaerales bacterium]
RPKLWDAWDIDREYVSKAEPVVTAATLDVTRQPDGGLQLSFTRAMGRSSRARQCFRFYPDRPGVIEADCAVDWQEEHRLLRVIFPSSLAPATFRAGTQFGHIDRPAAPPARGGGAMFECPFQGWLSIGEAQTRGITLVFPDRYGASCDRGTLGVSLLRSPKYPDPKADMGEHRFRYLILPWASSAFPFECSSLLWPARAIQPAAGDPGRPLSWSPIHTRLRLESATLDPHGRLMVRLSNPAGAAHHETVSWGFPVRAVEPVTILGEPTQVNDFVHRDSDPGHGKPATSFTIAPFQVLTLAVTRAD